MRAACRACFMITRSLAAGQGKLLVKMYPIFNSLNFVNLTLAESFVAPRLALIGDAAHGVHPIAGQGLNAGLRDIAALVQVLKEAKLRGEDIGASTTLMRYQEWRRFDATSLALATDTFNRLFSNDNSLLRLGRDMGMAMINAVPKARRSFIREAAGLTGTLPDLMR